MLVRMESRRAGIVSDGPYSPSEQELEKRIARLEKSVRELAENQGLHVVERVEEILAAREATSP